MPEKKTIKRARAQLRKGNSPSTAAGEFIREEIEHVREGKHGARSTEQAIAIGLSKARRAGIPLKKAPKRRARTRTGTRGGRSAVSHKALASHARKTAPKRTKADRSRAAKKAARTRARNAAAHR
jgi:hypothetical protein